MAAPYELRPLTIGELLDRAFTLYRRHFLVLSGIMLLATLLPGLLLVGFAVFVQSHPVASIAMMLLYVPLSVLGYSAATAATTHAVSAALLGEPVSIGESFRRVGNRILPVIGGSLLMGFGVLLGFLLLVVPGVIAAARWFMMIPALVIERGSVESSLRRSWALAQGSVGRILAVLGLVMALSFAMSMLLVMPLTFWAVFSHPGDGGMGPMQVVSQLAQYVANTLVLPVQSILAVLIYYDLRVRKEAFDVERMLGGLGQGPSNPVPPTPTPLG